MIRSAFSLVELSIVLVILGLLTGGILTGQSLIRAAELRSVTTDFQKYQTAVMTFKEKYFALPGDITNATDFWGAAHTNPATCATTASTGTETCNGDGDGQPKTYNLSGTGSAENFRFWQHLSNAGLIEGSYTGINGAGTSVSNCENGVNVPSGKMSNSLWTATYAIGTQTSSTNFFSTTYGNRLDFGSPRTNGCADSILTPEEQWNIDTKIDDGKPGYGKIMSFKSTSTVSPLCATTDDITTAEYNLSNTSVVCKIVGQPGW